jgi:hypothetical protein
MRDILLRQIAPLLTDTTGTCNLDEYRQAAGTQRRQAPERLLRHWIPFASLAAAVTCKPLSWWDGLVHLHFKVGVRG